MSYQVLARKWRPRNFKELVGQEHVQRALINALDNDRLHHAFLFTGTRGVGKTTIARILAKALNCEQGTSATPCEQCSTCQEINEGRYVDLIEVDAASRTKVEDTRELLDNVQYAPTRGRYKVYLIDEVHMLSTHSFNALLKTLEEPPPHVKFLLATTDPQKLPVTILSRCLQFNLKRLGADQIEQHLSNILSQEDIQTDTQAIAQVARAADGSMRDALSLLDQAIAYGGGKLEAREVSAMLGTVDKKYVYELLQGVAAGDANALIQHIQAIAEQSPNFTTLLDEILSLLHRISLAQMAPQALHSDGFDLDSIKQLAADMTPEDAQLYYQIGLLGKRDLSLAPDPKTGFEMCLLRMLAFKPVGLTRVDSSNTNTAAKEGGTTTAPQPISPANTSMSSSTAETAPTVRPAEPPRGAPPQSKSQSMKAIADTLANTQIKSQGNQTTAKNDTSQSKSDGSGRAPASPRAHPAPSTDDEPAPAASIQSQAGKAKQEALSANISSTFAASDTGNDKEAEQVSSAEQEPPAPLYDGTLPHDAQSWELLSRHLPINGIALEMARNCAFISLQENQIQLEIAESRKQLFNEERRKQLTRAVDEVLDGSFHLDIRITEQVQQTPAQLQQQRKIQRQQSAEAEIAQDHYVKQLIDVFDAQVNQKSIQPVD